MTAYVHGTSTRKVDDLVRALELATISDDERNKEVATDNQHAPPAA